MLMEYTGRGDAERSMRLLWDAVEEPSRGPAQGLDVARVVAAAIQLADEAGLKGLSMRAVAKALGRSPMSLYTYVPSKAELLDLMMDRALRELPARYDRADGWRAAMQRWARDAWDFYQRHPWVLQIGASRASLGPGEFAVYEAQMAILDGTGLTAMEMQRSVNALASFARGAARAVADATDAERETGVSDDDWWTERARWLEVVADIDWAARFPTLTRLEEEGAFAQDQQEVSYTVQEALTSFEHGLALMLDGVEALITRRQG